MKSKEKSKEEIVLIRYYNVLFYLVFKGGIREISFRREMQNWTVLFTGCMRKKISRNQMELEFYTKQEA